MQYSILQHPVLWCLWSITNISDITAVLQLPIKLMGDTAYIYIFKKTNQKIPNRKPNLKQMHWRSQSLIITLTQSRLVAPMYVTKNILTFMLFYSLPQK